MSSEAATSHAGFIWSVADLLRGVYKQSEYGRVILPLTVLRRLDCVLEPTKAAVLEADEILAVTLRNRDPVLEQAAGQSFCNTSHHTFATLLGDPDHLRNYITEFSDSARDIVDRFNFGAQIDRLDDRNPVYLVLSKFAELDMGPDAMSNLEMGCLYEELIRKFSELSNETAGEHFTPREVSRLIVNLLFREDNELLTSRGVVTTLPDPACGTGGMLSMTEEYLREFNPEGALRVFGQRSRTPRPRPHASLRCQSRASRPCVTPILVLGPVRKRPIAARCRARPQWNALRPAPGLRRCCLSPASPGRPAL